MTALHMGERGEAVRAAQQRLALAGYKIAPDGIFGPRTREAVQHARARFGLGPGGYDAALDAALLRAAAPQDLDAVALPSPQRGGLWVDTIPERVGRGWDWDGWARGLLATGCDDFAICAFGAAGQLWDSTWWDGPRLALAAQALRHHAHQPVTVGVCVWLDRRTYREGVKVWARETQDAAIAGYPLDYIELDAEEGWGTATAQDAAHVVAYLRPMPLRLTVIPHSGRTMRGSEAHLCRAILAAQGSLDLAPQVYSAYIEDKAWTHAAAFRPGVFQDLVARYYLPSLSGLAAQGPVRIHWGTALYGQRHPLPSPQGIDALTVALDAIRDVDDKPRVRFWSAKHITTASRAWMSKTLGGGVR